VRHLTPGQAQAAYPLMRQLAPELSLRGWLAYARRRPRRCISGNEGILLANRAGVAHPSGAVCYRRDRDMRQGAILTAEHIIALDLLYPEAVLAALLAELDCVAERLSCSVIRVIVPHGRPSLLENLCGAGHQAEGVFLSKTLGPRRPD